MHPPLRRDTLKHIQARNPKHTDVNTLLWEIARLRALVVQLNGLLLQWGDAATLDAVEDTMERLEFEPCVVESEFDYHQENMSDRERKDPYRRTEPLYRDDIRGGKFNDE